MDTANDISRVLDEIDLLGFKPSSQEPSRERETLREMTAKVGDKAPKVHAVKAGSKGGKIHAAKLGPKTAALAAKIGFKSPRVLSSKIGIKHG